MPRNYETDSPEVQLTQKIKSANDLAHLEELFNMHIKEMNCFHLAATFSTLKKFAETMDEHG